MKRVLLGGLAVVLAIGGCPGQQLVDPQPGTVTVLTAGIYSGPLSCKTIDDDGIETNQSTVTGRVLVTAEGGLRLYDDNITPGETLSKTQFGVTVEEAVGLIEQSGSTFTMHTTGSISVADERIDTVRTATLQQVDPQTILMTDESIQSSVKTGKSLTNTCTGNVTQ
jgi:hypothetical protein